MTLAGGTVSVGTAGRFAAVGLFGVAIDALLFQFLMSRGSGLALAHITSFFAAAVSKLLAQFQNGHSKILRATCDGISWPLPHCRHIRVTDARRRTGPADLWLAHALFSGHFPGHCRNRRHQLPRLRILRVSRQAESAPAGRALAGRFTRYRRLCHPAAPDLPGHSQLIPDEAYYWNYAQHMDLSFYDHPPMVAWLIWLGTAIFGNTEFGVRIGAFCCGLITMGYLYALARNLYDKSTAMRAVLLLAVLPFYFATGMVMTTDAPLVAAWAATLYYMERALIADRNSAWLGMGIAFGLGILSKYTLGLLGPAALLFVILDPASRRWLRRPHAYLAAALALLLFSPVIIWNMQHDWASIMFQSSRVKGVSEDQFSVH